MTQPEAILSLIINFRGGVHPGAWRHPDAPTDPSMDFDLVKRTVLTAERGKFQTVFLTDSLGQLWGKDPEVMALTTNAVGYEPLALCSALSMVTSRIGLALTMSTTYAEPFNVARMLASLDHLSGGRASWNVVASTAEAAPNFNDLLIEHSERYERAAEFFDVVTALWDSWEDDAFIRDKSSGAYFDADKLHVPHHRGKHFTVEGPLNVGRPIQGHPVIAQAGSSPAGLAFAAEIAELLFTLETELEPARELYAEVKEMAAESGRDRDHVKILSGLVPVLGRTQTEADEKLALLDELADLRVGIARLTSYLDFDLSGYPLDGPVPEIPLSEYVSKTGYSYYIDRARNENLTIRQLAKVAIRYGTVAMSTQQMVEHIEERLVKNAADGFNISFADAGGSLELFVDEVVPELQRRGLFWNDYRGRTLRENLGIPRPRNRFLAPISERA